MNPLGHFLIGYVIVLLLSLIIVKLFFDDLKFWSVSRFMGLPQFIAILGGLYAVFPDVSEFLGMKDSDSETWANLYFYHYSIDVYYHTITPNVRWVFELLPVLFLGTIALILNFWVLRQIIRNTVKANEVGKRLCKLADEYVGGIGPMIVQNVCIKAGYSLDSISTNDVNQIAGKLGKALGAFTGEVMSKEIQEEMSKIIPVPIYYNNKLLDDVSMFYDDGQDERDNYYDLSSKGERTLMYKSDLDDRANSKRNQVLQTLTHLEDYSLSRTSYLPVELIFSKKLCANCSCSIDDDWIYCPHCQTLVD